MRSWRDFAQHAERTANDVIGGVPVDRVIVALAVASAVTGDTADAAVRAGSLGAAFDGSFAAGAHGASSIVWIRRGSGAEPERAESPRQRRFVLGLAASERGISHAASSESTPDDGKPDITAVTRRRRGDPPPCPAGAAQWMRCRTDA